MRLWHYELVKNGLLPKSQLVAQWRELNSIFKKQDKHILINYIYDYLDSHLLVYTILVIEELKRRNIKIKSYENMQNYFKRTLEILAEDEPIDLVKLSKVFIPFRNEHDDRYLKQCFYNLQEKYDRGQKDFSSILYAKLEKFMEERK